ncbi:hypothetical protein EPO44_15655 [bacterium]|nr:MAG: hypothetical protein EPO44_15655 [bacterium]
MRSVLLSIAVLGLVLLRSEGAAELTSRKGRIQGENFVNLRSGPNLNYPSRAVLRKGDEVTVEREDGGWYLVSLADGSRGYVHKTLVGLLGDEKVKMAVQGEVVTKAPEKERIANGVGEETKSNLPVPPPPRLERESKGKPLPVVKVLEGKEREILWWLGAALCIFVIGWVCGGNYYLRRDRIRRRKLHF